MNKKNLFFKAVEDDRKIDVFHFIKDEEFNYKEHLNEAFLIAVLKQRVATVKYFIRLGANIHTHNDLAYTLADYHNNKEILEILKNN